MPKAHRRKPVPPGHVTTGSSGFQFEDPQSTPDDFNNFSTADRKADSGIHVNHPALQPVPAPRKNPPVMSLDEVLPAPRIATYKDYITFHSTGDTGGIHDPSHQFLVADKMVEDFTQASGANRPAFFYHLGDVVYYFGQDRYYYNQFYDPYRNYPAPIFAIPGNHDSVVYPSEKDPSLTAFRKHFCSETPVQADQAMGMARTTMTQPGVYFTLDAPFVKIIGLFSNTQEGSGSGVISDNGTVGQQQKNFLIDQLKQAKSGFQGAVIIAVHHPPFTGSEDHNPSPDMLHDIDDACNKAKFVPDVILSGHAHLYERYTRYDSGRQVPFVVAGAGGYYNLSGLKRQRPGVPPPRPPVESKDRSGNRVVLENYLDKVFGFLRLTVSKDILSCEFVGVSSDAAPSQTLDRFTLDLNAHKLTGFRHQ